VLGEPGEKTLLHEATLEIPAVPADTTHMAGAVERQPGEWVSEQAARMAAGHEPSADRWARGAHAESIVGYVLENLRKLGFEVVHDLPQPGEGNVDHLVSGPSGVFMIETKRWEYDAWNLRKAERQAAKLAAELGVWVTPVICLARRRPAAPYRDHGVWILGRERLVDWVTTQQNEVVEPGRLSRLADAL
jgi:Nuclease-related domain